MAAFHPIAAIQPAIVTTRIRTLARRTWEARVELMRFFRRHFANVVQSFMPEHARVFAALKKRGTAAMNPDSL